MLYFWTVGNGIPSDSMTFLIHDVYIGQNSIPKEPRILAILATLSTSINPPILRGYGIESSFLMNFDPMPDCQQLCNKSCTHKAAQAIMRNAARFSRIQVESSCPQQQPPLPQGLIAMCNYVWLTIESLWIPCATLEDPGGLLGVFASGFPGISVKWCTFWIILDLIPSDQSPGRIFFKGQAWLPPACPCITKGQIQADVENLPSWNPTRGNVRLYQISWTVYSARSPVLLFKPQKSLRNSLHAE